MTLSRGLFTSSTWEWHTPSDLRAAIDIEFGTTFDPCPGGTLDALLIPWEGRVFVNPPYGRVLSRWIEKGLLELRAGHAKCIVWLLPARTDTRWFHDLLFPNAKEIRFLRGRVHFENGEGRSGPAPFPSMIVVMERPHDPPETTPDPAARKEVK